MRTSGTDEPRRTRAFCTAEEYGRCIKHILGLGKLRIAVWDRHQPIMRKITRNPLWD